MLSEQYERMIRGANLAQLPPSVHEVAELLGEIDRLRAERCDECDEKCERQMQQAYAHDLKAEIDRLRTELAQMSDERDEAARQRDEWKGYCDSKPPSDDGETWPEIALAHYNFRLKAEADNLTLRAAFSALRADADNARRWARTWKESAKWHTYGLGNPDKRIDYLNEVLRVVHDDDSAARGGEAAHE